MRKILHPYSLAAFVAVTSLGILVYIGLIAPTPTEEIAEVKGAITEPVNYSKLQRIDYGSDLTLKDQSGYIDDEFIDQEEIGFTVYSETSVTYDLYEIKNKTGRKLSLRIIPQKTEAQLLNNLAIKLLINGGEFELYNHSQEPNKDYFAITIDPNESTYLRMNVTADKLPVDTDSSSITLQIREL